jgi:hypothetical protein
MRMHHLAAAALIIALGGCVCADTVQQTRFACDVTSDCLAGNVCRGGECRADDVPEGSCFPGERQACAVASCERPCAEDGGWGSCEPSTGPGFLTNPLNCGDCGRRCSDRLGDSLTCIDGRCTCVTDFDCPSGDVCLTGGVCGMNTDPCARITCASGSVCRAGACAPVACASGCNRGEVCDDSTQNCRPILPCRFAEPCGDGGVCEGRPQPDGEACNDGIDCTFGDSCTAGACSGTSYSCPAAGQCQAAVACAGDGGCAITPVTDGTPCDDAQLCTFADQCVSGVCSGSAYTCSPNQCAATSVCAGDGGCDVTPRNVGAACDDGVGCTFADVCGDAGMCQGTTYTCPGVTECKQAGLCLGDGGCDVVNKPDTTPCDDGLACSTADTCTNGVCGGTAGISYLDSDGDGRGDLTMSARTCPLGASYVLDGGDCNDTSAFVQNSMPAVRDADQDGVTAATTLDPAACVGPSTTVSGRTYFRSSSGAYNWLAAASATADCNEADPQVFESRPAMLVDADADGYTTGAAGTQCVGASSVINGRTYYANTSGAFVYLDQAAALGANDCLDSDADVFTNRAAALDVDHDGFTTTTTTSTRCLGAPSVFNGRTYYDDSAGNPNWLGSASSTVDCNDASATVTGTTLQYADGDGDGFGAGVGTARCAPVAGEVTNNTDCDDTNGFIHTNRSVATDADNDSFTLTTTTALRCTGSGSVVNTRTYYRDAANALSLLGTASSTVDCNDADVATFPQTVYPDTDGDTRGAAAGGQVQCPRQAGFVTNNTDCNDGAALVSQTVSGLYDDGDQDGYSNSAPASLCVGATTTVGSRTYYRTTTGAYPFTTTNLGADCNTSNGQLFTSRANVVPDDDRDGYPGTITDTTQCAGATNTSSGRTYYADGAGGYWMSRTDCLQRQGSNCDGAFVDCYDLNANANFTQASFFTAHRGDGSFDYNCSGTLTASTAATYCTSTTVGVALFTDASCSIPNGTGNICVTPSASSLPAACGKNTAGAATFTNPGACQADTLANSTVIGCR